MRVPESLATLFDYGVLEDVVRPLMSGKEAQVYLVVSGGKYAVAKIYKEAQNRTFKHRAEYTEGRKVRNTRDQRAMGKRSKHGREQDEAAWRSTEVDMIHRLHAAGVRVPVPYHFVDGVLVMELITDGEGNPAPRLGDIAFEPEAALAMYERLIREVMKMLCAGVVHGDLSEFNVLMSGDGPVIIDFPQSIDSAHNTNARKLLLRDVDNLQRFLSRVIPNARRAPYAQEMWNLYEQNLLTPDTKLRGDFRVAERRVNTAAVLDLIDDANRDERKRREALGLRGGPPPATRPEMSRGPAPQHRDANRGPAPQHRGGTSRGPGQGGGQGGPPRSGGRPPQAESGPKKDAPVYQGLANEGLSSAWGKRFRQNDDPRHRTLKLTPRGQGGNEPVTPAPNAQRPETQRPETRRHDQERRPPSGPSGAERSRDPRSGQGGQREPNRAPDDRGRSDRNAPPRGPSPPADRGRAGARPEVERIHARPNLGAQGDARDVTSRQRSEPTHQGGSRDPRRDASHQGGSRDPRRDAASHQGASRDPRRDAASHQGPSRDREPHRGVSRDPRSDTGSNDGASRSPARTEPSTASSEDASRRRRVRRSGATTERTGSDPDPKDR